MVEFFAVDTLLLLSLTQQDRALLSLWTQGGAQGSREKNTTEGVLKSAFFSLKKTHSVSLTFNKTRGIKEGNDVPRILHLVFPLHSWRVAIIL